MFVITHASGTSLTILAWLVPVLITLLLAGAMAMWKLAFTLATLQGQVHTELSSGEGNSLKDQMTSLADLRDQMKNFGDDSAAARIAAEWANQRAERVERGLVRLDYKLQRYGEEIIGIKVALTELTGHVARNETPTEER